jgi:hypothetical protein
LRLPKPVTRAAATPRPVMARRPPKHSMRSPPQVVYCLGVHGRSEATPEADVAAAATLASLEITPRITRRGAESSARLGRHR